MTELDAKRAKIATDDGEETESSIIDDMFADDDIVTDNDKNGQKITSRSEVIDDIEGYYSKPFSYYSNDHALIVIQAGAILDDGHYQIISSLGKGVYSSVIKAMDLRSQEEVAIKILRNNPLM